MLPIEFNEDHFIIELTPENNLLKYKPIENFEEKNFIFEEKCYICSLINIGVKNKINLNDFNYYPISDKVKTILKIIIERISNKSFLDKYFNHPFI